ncbi:MAG: hypothetical protein KA715_05545 [Xanthomonadaceae bacterium]|nr:hypothetical protein [Xanthomonadaceae bacterium]
MKLFLRCLLMGLLSPMAMAELSTEPTGSEIQSFVESLRSSGLSADEQIKLGCKLQTLSEMGWELQTSPSIQSITFASDTDGCSGTTPVLSIPSSMDDFSKVESDFNRALTSDATFCEYKSRLKTAGERAARKLYMNKGFGFRKPNGPFATFDSTGAWVNESNLLTKPAGSACEAIRALYSKPTQSDCAVGLHAVHEASQLELYGCENFDQMFSADELVLGNNWDAVMASSNIFYGAPNVKFGIFYEEYNAEKYPESHPNQFDPGAQKTAAKGRLALIGLSGYVGYRGAAYKDFLDDDSNKGQNFMIIDTSDAGAATLAARGVQSYDQTLEQAYHLMLKVFFETNEDGSISRNQYTKNLNKRYFDNETRLWLMNAVKVTTDWLERSDRGSNIPAMPTPMTRTAETDSLGRILTRVMELLNDPFLRDTQVFVHPHEKMSLGHYVVYQLVENARVPPMIRLYDSTVNTLLFTRYLGYKIESCKATHKQ